MLPKTVILNTGAAMPMIGLGTFRATGEKVKQAVRVAIETGYRSIDTAALYNNEQDIGDELQHLFKKDRVKRPELFITSKLAPWDHGRGVARNACLESISKLQCDYLDLYLIHWPGVKGLEQDDPKNADLRKESWMDLEELYKEGKVKAIGISNYIERHVEELMTHCTVKPALNQVEFHPFHNTQGLKRLCDDKGIFFQAYASLGTKPSDELRSLSVLHEIGKKHNCTAPQVLLQWSLKQSIGVIPASMNPDHIRENFDLSNFELSEDDMNMLNNLDKNKKYCGNPKDIL